MCSKRWANPVRPSRSFAEPTWYQRLTATIGAVWSSESVINNPFGNENVSMGMRIGLNCTPPRITGTLTQLSRATSVTHAVAVIAAALALLYVGLVVMLWYFQEQIVFQPPTVAPAANIPARRVRYRADDGVELFAYVIGECRANAPVVLAFHGNADLAR